VPIRRIGLAVVLTHTLTLGSLFAPLAVDAQQAGKGWRVGIL